MLPTSKEIRRASVIAYSSDTAILRTIFPRTFVIGTDQDGREFLIRRSRILEKEDPSERRALCRKK
jgi:hypothetical protein